MSPSLRARVLIPLAIGLCVAVPAWRLKRALEPKPSLRPPSHLFVPAPGDTQKFTFYDPHLKPGAMPFALPAKDLRGMPMSLAQYRGKVVMVDFWATWCDTCMGSIPSTAATYHKFHPKGYEIIGVSLDDAEVRPRLLGIAESHKMPWRQICEGEGWKGATARRFGIHGVPLRLLIGRDGRIADVNVGGTTSEAAIRKALARK